MGAAGARPFCLRKRKMWRWRRTARTACVGADHTRAPRSAGEEEKRFPERRCLKRRQGTGPQYKSWGAIFKERILRIQVLEPSISYDFLLCFFSGLFCNLPASSFSTDPCPATPTPHGEHHCYGELRPRDSEGCAPTADYVSINLFTCHPRFQGALQELHLNLDWRGSV